VPTINLESRSRQFGGKQSSKELPFEINKLYELAQIIILFQLLVFLKAKKFVFLLNCTWIGINSGCKIDFFFRATLVLGLS